MKFSNLLLTDHINLLACIPGRQCKRLNRWGLQKCSNESYYEVWNCGLLPRLCLHLRKWFSARVSVYKGTEGSAPVLLFEYRTTIVHENSTSHSFLMHLLHEEKNHCTLFIFEHNLTCINQYSNCVRALEGPPGDNWEVNTERKKKSKMHAVHLYAWKCLEFAEVSLIKK